MTYQWSNYIRRVALGVVALVAVGAAEASRVDAGDAKAAPPPPPVTVATPLAKRIVNWDEYSGRFAAVQTVEVRPRVSGFIDKLHFKDGQIVKAGQLLFTIDPRPFELALETAKAELARRPQDAEPFLWMAAVLGSARACGAGAWFAAVLFALHPVQVESVAWITERKNVLSGCFYLSSILAYLHFIRLDGSPPSSPDVPASPSGVTEPPWRFYGVALGLYLCALLSKTVTCTLPAAILLVVWWKRGRIDRSTLSSLIPFFLMGAALGLTTVWVEKQHVGAEGRVQVNFKRAGSKWLALEYAKLTAI